MNSSHSFEHCKFLLTSSFAESVELRVGVGKKGSRAVEFYNTPFFKKHYLEIVISLGATPGDEHAVTHAVVIDHSAKTVCNCQDGAFSEFTERDM
jgi:hypothetical protein